MARDSYTYLHLPMLAGMIVFAIGVKRTLLHVDAHLQLVAAVAFCGGVALYLLALSAFKRRNIGSVNRPRLVVAGLLAGLAPAATAMSALLALGLVTVTACGLIAFEFFATHRREIGFATAADDLPWGVLDSLRRRRPRLSSNRSG